MFKKHENINAGIWELILFVWKNFSFLVVNWIKKNHLASRKVFSILKKKKAKYDRSVKSIFIK